MNILLCSLYYEKNRVTGANKRFDYFGKTILAQKNITLTVVVREGDVPEWSSSAIVLPRYKNIPTPLRRVLYCLHLTYICSRFKGIIVNDFMPVPILFSKKNVYFQLVHDIRNFTDYNRAVLKKISSYIQKRQWKKVPNILTVSQFTKNQLIKYCNIDQNRIAVSYNGIEVSSKDKKNRDIDFLYIATFEKRKNHANLIHAFLDYTVKINSEACLYLIGRDLGYKQGIEALVTELGLTKSVIFIETITEHELKGIYERTCCFVSPSLYEGFGMPIIEAMYYGCNIACSNIEVFEEIAQEHAFYFEPNDVQSILQGMCLARSSENNNINNISYVESKFTWDSITAAFLNLVGK
ncbi:glycosyltransferase family 4 protein [Lelliottia aquatilis]|uniref:glycosyltransferase family 4 protein n=1 Tax=Lelliottia aquatilis TaxID=2080838 RepID=UPI0010575326|nr:glycosyltransferase family 1 protein [Lelliottia aquatilis]